jgi:hypothetical protein
MRKFDAWGLARVLHHIERTRTILAELADSAGGDKVTAEHLGLYITPIVRVSQSLSSGCKLQSTQHRVGDGGPFLTALKIGMTYPEILNELIVLRRCIEEDLANLSLILIRPPKERVLNDLDADWTQVWKQFPRSKYDSGQAMGCYALDLNTACVFHLMRVTEFGLRGLARRIGVRLPKSKHLEWPQWLGILRGMEDKVTLLAQEMKAGRRKDELFDFYRGALGQFYEFKNEFRSHVTHTPCRHGEARAATTVVQVKDFMNMLAFQIDEKGRRVDWLDQSRRDLKLVA